MMITLHLHRTKMTLTWIWLKREEIFKFAFYSFDEFFDRWSDTVGCNAWPALYRCVFTTILIIKHEFEAYLNTIPDKGTHRKVTLLTWLWCIHRLRLLLYFDLRKDGAKCCCATGCRLSGGGDGIGHRGRNRRRYSHGCREGRQNCRRLRGRCGNRWSQKSRNGLW